MRSRRVALCAAALCGAARGALDAPAPPASHPYAPPPPYYAEAQPAYAQNLWEIPPPPDARVALRPFRLATKQSVAFVYGLMAWRATSLSKRRRFARPRAAAKPLFAMNAAGCLIAARGAQKRKVALKAMLGVDVALRGSRSRSWRTRSSGRRRPSPDAHGLNALCAFWMGLICYTCSRSKWIASLPPPLPRARSTLALRASAESITVMSYNIRTASRWATVDGGDARAGRTWAQRRRSVARTVEISGAAVVGTQEGLGWQCDELFYEETQALVCFEFAEEMASSGPFAVDDVAFARCFYDSVTTVAEANRATGRGSTTLRPSDPDESWSIRWGDVSAAVADASVDDEATLWNVALRVRRYVLASHHRSMFCDHRLFVVANVGDEEPVPSFDAASRYVAGRAAPRAPRARCAARRPSGPPRAARFRTWASEGGGNLGLAPALRPGLYDGVAYHGLYALQCLAPFAFLVDWERWPTGAGAAAEVAAARARGDAATARADAADRAAAAAAARLRCVAAATPRPRAATRAALVAAELVVAEARPDAGADAAARDGRHLSAAARIAALADERRSLGAAARWRREPALRGALEARGLGHVADAFAAEGIVDAATAALLEDGEFARFDLSSAPGPVASIRAAIRASRVAGPAAAAAPGDAPEDLLCPITHELFRDPVFLADGHAYERSAIERWFAAGSA
ncbi:hypothetical protein JL720_16357 [Aureococcus anophagefferens]|nr:hypothetical protein JL720_16357 [Aureococcus anophagefferens]